MRARLGFKTEPLRSNKLDVEFRGSNTVIGSDVGGENFQFQHARLEILQGSPVLVEGAVWVRRAVRPERVVHKRLKAVVIGAVRQETELAVIAEGLACAIAIAPPERF